MSARWKQFMVKITTEEEKYIFKTAIDNDMNKGEMLRAAALFYADHLNKEKKEK